MPRLRDQYQLDLTKVPFDFPELIAALAPRAFFTNSPLRDANFEVEGVRACLTAARPIYDLLGVPDRLVAVHPDAEHSFPIAQRLESYRFLDGALANPTRRGVKQARLMTTDQPSYERGPQCSSRPHSAVLPFVRLVPFVVKCLPSVPNDSTPHVRPRSPPARTCPVFSPLNLPSFPIALSPENEMLRVWPQIKAHSVLRSNRSID